MASECPVLFVDPSSDDAFSVAAERALVGAHSIDRFTALLRETYPRVEVHPREISGEPVTIWYVYREGHWTSKA
jgi:hypothetical protein